MGRGQLWPRAWRCRVLGFEPGCRQPPPGLLETALPAARPQPCDLWYLHGRRVLRSGPCQVSSLTRLEAPSPEMSRRRSGLWISETCACVLCPGRSAQAPRSHHTLDCDHMGGLGGPWAASLKASRPAAHPLCPPLPTAHAGQGQSMAAAQADVMDLSAFSESPAPRPSSNGVS